MDLKGLHGRNKVIYECMWGRKDIGMKIEPSSDSSGTTLKLKGEPGRECEAIQQAYQLSNPEVFKKQFERAVSGNGDEAKKILILHSSSRCSLLCFYNAEARPIVLNIDGENIEFNYSTFEFKNPVIRYPSNMDVVLISKNKKIVLFLESKFSEYYMSASKESDFIGKSYRTNKYSKFVYARLNELGIQEIDKEIEVTDKKIKRKRKGFILKLEETSELNYLDGIKQMISHYVGIRRRLELKGRTLKMDLETDENRIVSSKVISAMQKADKIYLGEILYDRFKVPEGCEEANPKEIYAHYTSLYTGLAKILNEEISKSEWNNRFHVLPYCMTYSEVFYSNKERIDDSILRFYGIDV